MDITLFTELITSLGFPIALVIAMGLFIYKIYKQSEVREEKLMAHLEECREINSNAIATISLYAERLTNIETNVEVIKEDVKELKTHNV